MSEDPSNRLVVVGYPLPDIAYLLTAQWHYFKASDDLTRAQQNTTAGSVVLQKCRDRYDAEVSAAEYCAAHPDKTLLYVKMRSELASVLRELP